MSTNLSSSNLNFLKATNFQIVLPNNNILSFNIRDVNFPGFSIQSPKAHSISQLYNIPGSNIEWDDVNISIYCDENLNTFNSIYNLMVGEIDPISGNMNPPNVVKFDSNILFLSNKNNIQYKLTLIDSFISRMEGFELLYATENDSEPLVFKITLKYSYYTFSKILNK